MKKMSYETKKSWVGLAFLLPWIIGMVFIFFRPLIQSLLYSFNKIKIMEGGVRMTWMGFDFYKKAFEDPDFVRKLTQSINNMAFQVPLIIIMSLFIAVLLNQKFKGRTFIRGVFFLPVIIASGVVIGIINGDAFSQIVSAGQKSNVLFQASFVKTLLAEAKVSQDITNFIMDVINGMFELIWKSGIQILIFMAALTSIPEALYESSKIEGATGWETFWKITFPMISPMILLNLVYTIIDSFTDYSNPLMRYIDDINKKQLDLSYSASMSWIYFLIVFTIIGVVYAIINRKVFYQVD